MISFTWAPVNYIHVIPGSGTIVHEIKLELDVWVWCLVWYGHWDKCVSRWFVTNFRPLLIWGLDIVDTSKPSPPQIMIFKLSASKGKLKAMFPKSQNRHDMEKRSGEKYSVNKAFTERYRRSAIPNMQRLLNNLEKEKKKIFRKIENSVPVNYAFY